MVATFPLFSFKHELDTSPEAFGELRRSSDALDDPAELNRRLNDDGYLYIPSYLPTGLVHAGRAAICERLAAEDSLDPAHPVIDAIARPDKVMTYRGDLAVNNTAVQRVVFGPEMMRFYERLFGEPVRHFDHLWFRAVSRGQGTPPHADLVYMSRGTHQLLTCWIPYGETPLEVGGLMVLEGSHKQEQRLRNYLEVDVDHYCENRPKDVAKVRDGGGWSHPGYLTTNPYTLRQKLGGRWLTAEYQPGDILTFKMTLLHGSLDNQTDRIRLSSDTRYQRASQPADPRWVGSKLALHNKEAKLGRIC